MIDNDNLKKIQTAEVENKILDALRTKTNLFIRFKARIRNNILFKCIKERTIICITWIKLHFMMSCNFQVVWY